MRRKGASGSCARRRLPILSLLTLTLTASELPFATGLEFPAEKPDFTKDILNLNEHYNLPRQGPPETWRGDKKPLKITNRCPGDIWPGILTQHGVGPGTGGFELPSRHTINLWVGPTWQGRVWGRTNCTVNGDSASCRTGDCFGKLSCDFAGDVPVTLAEFTLAGGVANRQTFYDISLVDGYNLPVSINYIPAANTTFIPPNLTNCACIATPGYLAQRAMSGLTYSNSTFPIPWEPFESNESIRRWCPWSLLAHPPNKPGDGIYPYPDDNIQRPDFSPCLSQCAATGRDEDCCVGDYHDPEVCQPGRYSSIAKAMCPDAYSFAYDDQQSTFIIPSGGGWEVVFCPRGRSTNILRTLGDQMFELAAAGRLSNDSLRLVKNREYIEKRSEETASASGLQPSCAVLVFAVVFSLLLG